MFREMRRKRQQLTEAECIEILKRNTSGVLAVSGDNGYPYAVPLNYVYDGGSVYFHCAKSGHKLDAIRTCDKVSLCVVEQDLVVPTVENLAKEKGLKRVVIHTTEDNHTAQMLYSSSGYLLMEIGPCTTADGQKRVGYTYQKVLT